MVMHRAGVIDLTPFGKLEVKGPDAHSFIDRLCANSVPRVGQTNISHMLTPSGRVYAELTITALADDHFLCVTGSGSEYHDQRWIETKAREWNADVTIRNVTDDVACLGLAGPKSREILSKLTDTDLSHEAFPFLHCKQMDVAGVLLRAIRISYTGELGWEMYMAQHEAAAVYTALLQAGEEFGLGDFGSYAMSSLRLEKGFRAWGSEMTVDNNPLEAGLGFFVKLKKEADFVGKSALLKLKETGLHRSLAFLTVDTTDVDPEGNESIYHNGKVVGNTTSGAYGYTVKKSIAFGYLPTDLCVPGTQVHVDLLGQHCLATVHKQAPVQIEPVRTRTKKKAAAQI